MKIGALWTRLFGVLSAVSLLFLVADARTLHAQSANAVQPAASAPVTPAAAGVGVLEFDAVSVRPTKPKMAGADFLDPNGEMPPPKGGLFIWNVPLSFLIDFAYSLKSGPVRVEAYQGLPKPEQSQWYSVEARAEGDPSRDDVRRMVRSMLEARFQFKAHLEKREGDVLALEVVKPGLGLKPHPEGAPCTLPAALMDERSYPHTSPPYKTLAPRCGEFNRVLSHSGERRLELLDVTMQQIVDALAGMNSIPVIDRTNLQGRYDAVLEYGRGGLPPDPDPGDKIGVPQFPVALERQLGLRLNKQRDQVNVFVIDHIGALSEN